MDCYSHEEGRHIRIGNRLFYKDLEQAVEPSAHVVVAADAWAGELAQSTPSSPTATVFCTPVRYCSPAVELRPSQDPSVAPQSIAPYAGPEAVGVWLNENPDMETIEGRDYATTVHDHRLVPRHAASWLREVMATGGALPALAGGLEPKAIIVSVSRSDMANGGGVGVPTGVGTGVARGFCVGVGVGVRVRG